MLDRLLQGPQVLDVHHLAHLLEAGDHPLDDDELLGGARVVDEHLQHEPVDLRLGKRIGPVGLDRVLRRHDQEGVGQGVGLPADGDLALLHRFEQGALHLGRGPVDLVGQDQVGEDRAERHLELAELLVVDPRADDVGRHEVGRELDALELDAERVGEGLHRQRLGQSGHALDEQMAARHERDDHPLEERVLADDHPLDVVEHVLEGHLWPVGCPSRVRCSFGRGAGCSAGRGDRHGEPDAGKVVGPCGVGEACHDPDHLTFRVE